MKLITQLGPHCLLYSAAMVLNTPVEVLRKEIGYTGNEIWWPNAKKPVHRLRTFHMQEIIDCALRRNIALTPIEVLPRMSPEGMEDNWKLMADEIRLRSRIQEYLKNRIGILIGTKPSGPHAVAWAENHIYDPSPIQGGIYELGKSMIEFRICEFWIANRIQ